MCESKRVLLINSKNAWHKLFTHRLNSVEHHAENTPKNLNIEQKEAMLSPVFSLISYTCSQPVNEEKLFDFRCVPNWNVFPFFRTLQSEKLWFLSKIDLSFSINPSSSLQAVSFGPTLCVWMQWHFCFLFALPFFVIEIYQSRSIFDVWQYCLLRIRLFFSMSFLLLSFSSWSVDGQSRSQHIFLSQQF